MIRIETWFGSVKNSVSFH